MSDQKTDQGGESQGNEQLFAILDSVKLGAIGHARTGVELAVKGQRRILTRWVLAPARSAGSPLMRRLVTAGVVLLLLVILACALPPVGQLVVDTLWDGSLELSAQQRAWLDGLRICLEVLTVLCIGGGAYSEVVRRAVRQKLQSFEADLQQQVSEQSERLERRTKESCDRLIEVLRRADRQPPLATLRDLLGESDRFGRKVITQVPRHYDLFLLNQVARSFPGGILGLTAFVLYLGVVGLKIVKLWASLPA